MKLFFFSFLLSVASFSFTQEKKSDTDIQSSPKLVLEEVFRAAQTSDYSNLYLLCPPSGENDGDTQQFICNISSASVEQQNEFKSYFEKAYITGEVKYSNSSTEEKASIDFWFNHPGGESRSNETMHFVKMNEKWFLLSF